MKMFDHYGNEVLCRNVVPQKKGEPPIVCEGTNDWTAERSEAGYGVLLRCIKCGKLVRWFKVVADGNKVIPS